MAENGLKMVGREIVGGTAQPVSLLQDDDGNYVVRVVDAAPFAYDAVNDKIKVTADSRDVWTPVVVFDNAANNSKTITVPAGKEYIVQVIAISLVTNATVGNRIIGMAFDNGAYPFFSDRFEVAITASQTKSINIAPNLALSTAFGAGNKAQMPIPEMRFAAGYRIRMYEAANISATDSLTYVALLLSRNV